MEIYFNIHAHGPRNAEQVPQSEGLHPWQAEGWHGEQPAFSPHCEVVGEIGLDFHCPVDRTQQHALFCAQLQWAEQHEKPVVLHCVKAFEEVMRTLKNYTLKGVIFHGFIGSWQQAQRALERGYYLSFGPPARRSPRTLEVLRSIALDRLFLESDTAPEPIAEWYEEVARRREITPHELKQQIELNWLKING